MCPYPGRECIRRRLRSPVGDRILPEADFRVFEQFGGHLLTSHAQAIHFEAFGAIDNDSIDEEVCQFLLGKSPAHVKLPSLEVRLNRRPCLPGGVLYPGRASGSNPSAAGLAGKAGETGHVSVELSGISS